MVDYGLGLNGIHRMLAQAENAFVLPEWFESTEERRYHLSFADYCAQVSAGAREGYRSPDVTRAYSLLGQIGAKKVATDDESKESILKDINKAYFEFLESVGNLMVKESALYNQTLTSNVGVEYKPFNIRIEIPDATREYFGVKKIRDITEAESGAMCFYEILSPMEYEECLHSSVLVNALRTRQDISFKSLITIEDEVIKRIFRQGVTYLEMSSRKIKGRID